LEKYVVIEQIPLILLNFLKSPYGGGENQKKEKAHASNRGKMSVKRASECERALKGLKEF
jgi:hypothetical protein